MIRMDYESVQEAADALSLASTSCLEAAAESQRSRAQVVSSVEAIAASQRRVETLIATMKHSLDVAEHKAANATWDGESYDQFYAEVGHQRANIRRVEQQYREAYEESMSSFEQLRQRVIQLDETFGRNCDTASSAYEKMSRRARQYSDQVLDVASRGMSS